jgi:hypothetical protein
MNPCCDLHKCIWWWCTHVRITHKIVTHRRCQNIGPGTHPTQHTHITVVAEFCSATTVICVLLKFIIPVFVLRPNLAAAFQVSNLSQGIRFTHSLMPLTAWTSKYCMHTKFAGSSSSTYITAPRQSGRPRQRVSPYTPPRPISFSLWTKTSFVCTSCKCAREWASVYVYAFASAYYMNWTEGDWSNNLGRVVFEKMRGETWYEIYFRKNWDVSLRLRSKPRMKLTHIWPIKMLPSVRRWWTHVFLSTNPLSFSICPALYLSIIHQVQTYTRSQTYTHACINTHLVMCWLFPLWQHPQRSIIRTSSPPALESYDTPPPSAVISANTSPGRIMLVKIADCYVV